MYFELAGFAVYSVLHLIGWLYGLKKGGDHSENWEELIHVRLMAAAVMLMASFAGIGFWSAGLNAIHGDAAFLGKICELTIMGIVCFMWWKCILMDIALWSPGYFKDEWDHQRFLHTLNLHSVLVPLLGVQLSLLWAAIGV